MRYVSICIVSCGFALAAFSQSSQTVTLVFIPPPSDYYKNYEAVIDDVSYYSENKPSGHAQNDNTAMRLNNRNTTWLQNFQPGRHTIQVYIIKDGSANERAANTPLYTSAFTVTKGFDTKIAVRSNGQVQFSEQVSADDSKESYEVTNDKQVATPHLDDNTAGNHSPDGNMPRNEDEKAANNS